MHGVALLVYLGVLGVVSIGYNKSRKYNIQHFPFRIWSLDLLFTCKDTENQFCWVYTPRKPELKDTHVPQMFIAALFIIARTWKQPRCPSADEWIRKLWYLYTMEYYLAIKKNVFESVLMRWMKLEPIIQSEVSQKEKHQYSILTHIYGI